MNVSSSQKISWYLLLHPVLTAEHFSHKLSLSEETDACEECSVIFSKWKINFLQLWLKLCSQRQESLGRLHVPVRQNLSVPHHIFPSPSLLYSPPACSRPQHPYFGVRWSSCTSDRVGSHMKYGIIEWNHAAWKRPLTSLGPSLPGTAKPATKSCPQVPLMQKLFRPKVMHT